MSYMVMLQSSRLGPRPGGYADEEVQGDAGERGTGESGGHHAKGFAPVAESAQRPGPAELRRGRLQRATNSRRGRGAHPEDQHAQDRPGQEALRRGRAGGGPGEPPRPTGPREKGGW